MGDRGRLEDIKLGAPRGALNQAGASVWPALRLDVKTLRPNRRHSKVDDVTFVPQAPRTPRTWSPR